MAAPSPTIRAETGYRAFEIAMYALSGNIIPGSAVPTKFADAVVGCDQWLQAAGVTTEDEDQRAFFTEVAKAQFSNRQLCFLSAVSMYRLANPDLQSHLEALQLWRTTP